MDNGKKVFLPIALILAACICCCAVGGSSVVILGLLPFPISSTESVAVAPTQEGTPIATDQSGYTRTPDPGPAPTALPGNPLELSDPAPAEAFETLQSLAEADPPAGDVVEQVERLKGIKNIPRVVTENAPPVPVGTKEDFYVMDSGTNETSIRTAVMRYGTPHVYFWVDQEIEADDDDIRYVTDIFEEQIYPTDREFFGPEWSPGIDGDVHIYILYTGGMGAYAAGYYMSVDSVSHLAHPFSNEHEMFYINGELEDLRDKFVLAVLAHEFQHMIHKNGDPNEDSWVDEGFAELAVDLNGYTTGGWDWAYANDTDLQLNTWIDITENDSGLHYGASFMFMKYLLGRFGSEATKALVRNPLNGLNGIDDLFRQLELSDPSGARLLTAEDVIADFGAAMLLQDASFADGRFGFRDYPTAPELGDIRTIKTCPSQKESKKVSQFGFDYYEIRCQDPSTIYFAGQTETVVLSAEARGGKYYAWSNRSDNSDMILTRAFDLPAGKPATLEFDLWYDIEEDWDYAYLEASTDGGNTWQLLRTEHGTDYNPLGSNYGWGWTGASEGWVEESVDLSAYAGKNVLVRFEYITDANLHMEGLAVDNIRIPEIGYATDFENGLDGWEALGFARIQNVIPQSYRVFVVRTGDSTTVEEMALDDRMSGGYRITPAEGEEVYLMVLGTARYTRQKAPYQFIIVNG
ncbi:MAG: immune inhibitor A [Anaerolineales bacterium]|nr:immune inhibitor A [Anaerolineales bacterium]